MTTFDTENFIKKQWAELPLELKQAISESGWIEKLQEIAQKANLTKEDTKKLETEIILLFLGGTNPLDFLENIAKTLNWQKDNSKTTELYQQINNEILMNVVKLAKSRGLNTTGDKEPTKEELELIQKLDAVEEDETNNEILLIEQFKTMPKNVQDLFIDGVLTRKIKTVGDKFNLNENNLSSIENALTIELLSNMKIEEVKKNLQKSLSLPSRILDMICEEINKQILLPLKENMNEGIKENDLGKQQTDPRFSHLPQSIQNSITDSNYGPKIFILGKEYGLTIAQTTEIEELVVNVILRTVSKDQFESRAQKATGLDPTKLRSLTDKINKQILQGIHNEVLGTHNTPIQNPAEENVEIKASEAQGSTTPEQNKSPVKKPNFDSIILNKLAGLSKNAGVTTDYSLEKVSKSGDENNTASKPKIDPYRMPIDL